MRITIDTAGPRISGPNSSGRRADHLGCQGANSDASHGGSAFPRGQKSGEMKTRSGGDRVGPEVAEMGAVSRRRGVFPYPVATAVAALALVAALAIPRPARAEDEHRVGRGETWSGIAKRHGTNAAALAAANRKTVNDALREGAT